MILQLHCAEWHRLRILCARNAGKRLRTAQFGVVMLADERGYAERFPAVLAASAKQLCGSVDRSAASGGSFLNVLSGVFMLVMFVYIPILYSQTMCRLPL